VDRNSSYATGGIALRVIGVVELPYHDKVDAPTGEVSYICRHINMKPTAPKIKSLIKMHKPHHPIRTVVNLRGAPAYKIAGPITQRIKQLAPLPNRHNVDNTLDVIKKLNDTPIFPHFTLVSLDITNLYINFRVTETRDFISNTLKRNLLDTQTQQEL